MRETISTSLALVLSLGYMFVGGGYMSSEMRHVRFEDNDPVSAGHVVPTMHIHADRKTIHV